MAKKGGALPAFEELELIRVEGRLSVRRFLARLGIPRSTWYYWRAGHLHGRAVRRWPAPVVDALAPRAAETAHKYAAWGHRKIWAMLRADGVQVSASSVERALRRSELPPGGRLGLWGFGSSAHVVIQIARHRGAEVFVVTRAARHRALARTLGACWVGEIGTPMPAALDAAIVFAPAGEIVPAALRALRPGGTVALAGIHMTPVPPLAYEECLFHEKTLRSVEANTRADGEALLAEAAAIPIRPRVTPFPLAEANQALARLRADQLDGTGVLVVAEDPR